MGLTYFCICNHYGTGIKHKICSNLEESMKLGTKIHLGMDKSNWLGSTQKCQMKNKRQISAWVTQMKHI